MSNCLALLVFVSRVTSFIRRLTNVCVNVVFFHFVLFFFNGRTRRVSFRWRVLGNFFIGRVALDNAACPILSYPLLRRTDSFRFYRHFTDRLCAIVCVAVVVAIVSFFCVLPIRSC